MALVYSVSYLLGRWLVEWKGGMALLQSASGGCEGTEVAYRRNMWDGANSRMSSCSRSAGQIGQCTVSHIFVVNSLSIQARMQRRQMSMGCVHSAVGAREGKRTSERLSVQTMHSLVGRECCSWYGFESNPK
jgi:hypothetical protein